MEGLLLRIRLCSEVDRASAVMVRRPASRVRINRRRSSDLSLFTLDVLLRSFGGRGNLVAMDENLLACWRCEVAVEVFERSAGGLGVEEVDDSRRKVSWVSVCQDFSSLTERNSCSSPAKQYRTSNRGSEYR
jgi:hypothetical protein